MLNHRLAALLLAIPLVFTACGKEETPAPSAPKPSSPTEGRMPPPTTSAASAASVTQATAAQAQKLLDDAAQYVKDNKLDLADKTITQLEGMKPNLPAEYGPKIDDLRKAFNAAKAAMPAGMKMPGQ